MLVKLSMYIFTLSCGCLPRTAGPSTTCKSVSWAFIFRNAILKCSKTELIEIPRAKRSNNKVSNSIGVQTGVVGTVCQLPSMLMLVFGRISVRWHNSTMNILAYRAGLAQNFVEKDSLIRVSIKNMCGINLI